MIVQALEMWLMSIKKQLQIITICLPVEITVSRINPSFIVSLTLNNEKWISQITTKATTDENITCEYFYFIFIYLNNRMQYEGKNRGYFGWDY